MSQRVSLLIFLMLPAVFVQAQVSGAPPFFESRNNFSGSGLPFLEKIVRAARDSNRPIRILHLGDSHVKSGFFTEAFADSLNRMLIFQKNNTTVQLIVMAKNGATSKHFLEDVYQPKVVQQLQPDVIIISLGTNEAQNLFSTADLQKYFTALLAQLRADAPAAALLFTTPGDALRKTNRLVKRKKGYYNVASFSVNPLLPVVVGFLKSFADENKAALWNWYEVMGSKGAVYRWAGHGFANADHIHLTQKGYNLQGWLLANAFAKMIINPAPAL